MIERRGAATDTHTMRFVYVLKTLYSCVYPLGGSDLTVCTAVCVVSMCE